MKPSYTDIFSGRLNVNQEEAGDVFSIDELEPGKWYEISAEPAVDSEGRDNSDERMFDLPLVAEKKIIVELEYAGNIECVKGVLEIDTTDCDMEEDENSEEIHGANLLNEENLKGSNPNYRFEIECGKPTNNDLLNLEAALKDEEKSDRTLGLMDIAEIKVLISKKIRNYANQGYVEGHVYDDGNVCVRMLDGFVELPMTYEQKKQELERKIETLTAKSTRHGVLDLPENIIELNNAEIQNLNEELKSLTPEKAYAGVKPTNWFEVSPSKTNEKRKWTLANTKNYPAEGDKIQYTALAVMPRFLNPEVKTAKLRVTYENL